MVTVIQEQHTKPNMEIGDGGSDTRTTHNAIYEDMEIPDGGSDTRTTYSARYGDR